MNFQPIQPSIFRTLVGAVALGALAVATHAGAQERPGLAAVDPRIDQFVTTQDSATGLGGAISQDSRRLSDTDRAFLADAHQLEMFQVHAGVVALKRRKAGPAVHSHARRMLHAHQASLVAIEKLARDHGQELERRFTPEFEERAFKLRKASRSGFGPVFFGQMLELHERALALYDDAASTTANAELRSLVQDSLPTLRTQLADAEQFSRTVGTVAAR